MNVYSLFNIVIKASIFGSVVGLILFAFKSAVLRKLAARWQCALWWVMILKLMFPNGPESSISIFNKINVINTVSETDLISIAQRPNPISDATVPLHTVLNIIPYLWLAGFTLTMLWNVISFILLKFKLRSSSAASNQTIEILNRCKKITGIKKDIKVVVQDHISSASLYGIVHPKILITDGLEKSDITHMEYTFIHELCHCKRGDIAVNYLLLFLQCIHWFNPVICFLFSKIRRDTELATDEQTILYIQPKEHKKYGTVLINTLSSPSLKAPKLLGMSNNKKDLIKRIKAIAKFKKPGILNHLSGILTLLASAIVCLTSAVAAKPISDAIYKSIPMIRHETQKYIFGKNNPEKRVIESVAEETKANEEKDETNNEIISEEIKEDKPAELESLEIQTIDNLISRTGQIIDTGSDTTDLNKYAKVVHYNTDYDSIYTVTVKPNSNGYIQFFIENQGDYDHNVKIGISNIETDNPGWDYQFLTEGKTPIYLDGYYPDQEYVITIDCYCPGHYNIGGRILIY